MPKTILGEPVRIYETDPVKGEKVANEFWQKMIAIVSKDKEKQTA